MRAVQPLAIGPTYRSYPAAEMDIRLRRGYVSLLDGSPYEPARDATLEETFPELAKAITRARPQSASMLASVLSNPASVPTPQLISLHQEIADDLLRLDPDVPFWPSCGPRLSWQPPWAKRPEREPRCR